MAEIGNFEKIKFLAVDSSFAEDSEIYTTSLTSANNQLFMKFGKTDWDTSTEVGKLALEVVNHLTAAELIKNKPLKQEHAMFLIGEAERMMKLIANNPSFGLGITSQPITTVMGLRKFRTRGMDETIPWYKSPKVNHDGNTAGQQNSSSYLAS